MTPLLAILTIIYIISAIGLAIFSASIFVLILLWFIHRNHKPVLPHISDDDLPPVLIQLPIYNEKFVVRQLLQAMIALDYPKDRLYIQILDDSTDDTVNIIADLARHYQRLGWQMTHVRRPQRVEYKAGALQYGLGENDAPFVAIFDADFVPAPDFLRQTIPYFLTNPQIGIVQGRWAHLNAEQNLITRSQAMSVDGHFVIEQTARSRGGLLLSFNGTAGVWRRSCIEDAGGWTAQTTAEDLDLSFRAQMRGWKVLYLPDVAVPAELPPQIAAYKAQQSRWAKGVTQNLFRLLPGLWRSEHLNIFQKIMATIHLFQYVTQVWLLILTILNPVLMLTGVLQTLPLAPLGLLGLAAPIMYVISQRQLYDNWLSRLIAFPVLLAIGSGVMFTNTIGVIEAITRRPNNIKRTPKFSGGAWANNQYALSIDWTIFCEIALTLYTASAGILAISSMPTLIPLYAMQSYGFGTIVFWGMMQERQRTRVKMQPLATTGGD
jgi:cellulose synthase/poly-beta-1,6-N-acetylglucosamine synthase-like glycosyltransferase